jgi:hypothetical protein
MKYMQKEMFLFTIPAGDFIETVFEKMKWGVIYGHEEQNTWQQYRNESK